MQHGSKKRIIGNRHMKHWAMAAVLTVMAITISMGAGLFDVPDSENGAWSDVQAGNGKPLIAENDQSYSIFEYYVDAYGNPIGQSSRETYVLKDIRLYSETVPSVQGYTILGYKWDSAPDNSGTDFNPSIDDLSSEDISGDRTIYFVYGIRSSWTEIDLNDSDGSLNGAAAGNWKDYYQYDSTKDILTIKKDAPAGWTSAYRIYQSGAHDVKEIILSSGVTTSSIID
ncbi:MAG: hypothetical protein LBH88_01295, partial [Candidatus Methanoplasma sp.]|nr:hypothetical protein [Candidatus Methanoplasma sp.]